MKVSPHLAFLQAFVQVSVLLLLPSSHSSPASFWPSPQRGKVQVERHRSATSSRFSPSTPHAPPKHCDALEHLSPAFIAGGWQNACPPSQPSLGCLIPSPHFSFLPVELQPSPLIVLPSSHCSLLFDG